MKLLHFADLHLGIENYGSLNPRTGLSTRVDDFLAALDAVIDAAISEQVDAVLFAGDAFKNRDPSPTLQRMFAKRIRRLAEAAIPTVLLTGNHDVPSIAARATAIDIYEALAIPHIHPARNITLHRIDTKSGPLQVVTLPWVPRNMVTATEEFRRLSADEQLVRLADVISQAVTAQVAKLDPSLPSVLLGHLSLEGARLGSEQSIMLGAEVVLTSSELSLNAFGYVALGHIHRHQRLSAKPPVVYAGSIERVDFSEEHEEKGYVIVEFEPSNDDGWGARWSFKPLPTRPFLTLRIDIQSDDPMEEIRRIIERRRPAIEGAIVRMNIQVSAEREEQVRVDEIRRWLQAAGALWIARVTRDVESQNRPRVDIHDEEALIPEKMLEHWLEMRELPEALRDKIRAAGIELIQSDRATPSNE